MTSSATTTKPTRVPDVGPRGRQRRKQAWIIEVALIVGLATIYNWVRAQQGTDAALAISHGIDIAHAEGPLFNHLEIPLNHWLSGVPAVAVASCYFYALMHYAMTPGVLFMSWRTGGWHYHRGYWSLIIASGIALVIYASFPVAPPRLLPQLGVTDVMRDFAQFGWWGGQASAPRGLGDATNQYAAMPSLHFGWSLWCGIQMWNWKSKLWRIPAVLYPTLQLLVVLATGNHFLFDVLAGAGCVLAAHALMQILKPRITAEGDTRERADVEVVSQAGPREAAVASPPQQTRRMTEGTAGHLELVQHSRSGCGAADESAEIRDTG